MLYVFPESIQLFADHIVCYGWVIAYSMCLYGTVKEKKPGFHPSGSLPILAWEFFGVITLFPYNNFNYLCLSRTLWFLLHFSFFVISMFKLWRNRPLKIYLHFFSLVLLIAAMYLVYKFPNGQLWTSYFNTIIGWLITLVYIIKSQPPPSRAYLGFAVFGFIADAAGILEYLDTDYVTIFLCFILQIMQLIHVILVYRCLKRANVKIFDKSVFNLNSFLLDFEKSIKRLYIAFNTYINKKFSLKSTNSHRKKYKKKSKSKKTHRKK